MSNASANQTIKVNTELKIEAATTAGQTQGRLSFVDSSNRSFGSFRVFGQWPFARLVLDSNSLTSGVAFRTNSRQGNDDGGTGEKYSCQITNSGVNVNSLSVSPPVRNGQYARENGEPIVEVFRNGTSDSNALFNIIQKTYQSTWKPGETMLSKFGTNFYHGLGIGFYTPDGTQDSTENKAFMSYMLNSSTDPTKHLIFSSDGNIQIPQSLSVGIISATTYLNLPAVPAGDLLPLTLDKTNNFVGVNTLVPSNALDVTGNAKVSGSIAVGSGGITITSSSSSPEGTVSAPVGSLYMRTDGSTGTSVYVKESGSGNTGWNTLIAGGTPPSWSIYRGYTGTAPVTGVVSGYTTDLVTPSQCTANKSTGIVTITVAGRYYISFNAFGRGTIYNDTNVYIRVNNINKCRQYAYAQNVNALLPISLSGTFDLNVGDTVTIFVDNTLSGQLYPDDNCLFSGQCLVAYTAPAPSTELKSSWSVFKSGMSNQSGTITYSADASTPSNCTVNKGAGTVTITVAGRYNILFHGFKMWYSGQSECEIMVNNVSKARGYTGWNTTEGYFSMSISVNLDLVVGDVVKINWGGIESVGHANCYFSGNKIA